MSIVLPTDGYGIYEDINPDRGQAIWGPRIDQMAAGGFKIIINYGICYGHTANMLAYLYYAASKGMKVAVALHTVWTTGNLATLFPTMYVEAGSPGATNYNAFATYVVNQCKNQPGVWGYYLADEPYNTSHTNIKSMHDAVVAADSSKPTLIVCTSDTSSGQGTFWDSTTTMYDACSVGGDDTYPIGLPANSVTGFTIGIMSADIQAFTASKSIQSTIVLQGFNFSGIDPSLADMQAMLGQALAHMTPQLILWFGYYYIFGGPGGAYAPQAADPNAATLWANLVRALGSVPPRYVTTVLADSPIKGFRLDDPLCFAYGDDFMSANVATVSTAVSRQHVSLLSGDLDVACAFNGIDSAFTLNTAGLPTAAHAFSLECWVQATSWPGAGFYPGFVTMGTAGVGGQSASLSFDGDAQRLIFIFKGLDAIQALAAPTNGATYHLVGTYDGTQARFYVNGVLQQVARNEALNLVYGAAYIGRDIDGNNFLGTIDEVWIYNTALSAARVLAHYNAGLCISPRVAAQGNGRFVRIG